MNWEICVVGGLVAMAFLALRWAHRGWGGALISAMVLSLVAMPFVFAVAIGVAWIVHLVGGSLGLNQSVLDWIGAGLVGLLLAAGFIAYCIQTRQSSGITAAPVDSRGVSSSGFRNTVGVFRRRFPRC